MNKNPMPNQSQANIGNITARIKVKCRPKFTSIVITHTIFNSVSKPKLYYYLINENHCMNTMTSTLSLQGCICSPTATAINLYSMIYFIH